MPNTCYEESPHSLIIIVHSKWEEIALLVYNRLILSILLLFTGLALCVLPIGQLLVGIAILCYHVFALGQFSHSPRLWPIL